MALVTRRRVALLAAGGAFFGALRVGEHRLARQPAEDGPYRDATAELLARCWTGLDPRKVLDVHTHLVGLGTGGSGCEVSERSRSKTNPGEYLKFSIYLEAAGITDDARADQQYVERLVQLMSAQRPHGRLLLMAFDRAYDDAGEVLPGATEFFTPNDWALAVAKAHPEYFVVCGSVHPYRPDALAELERVVTAGAVAIKWLPNAMNIDPSSERCDAFYDALVRLRVPLICHAGEEKAVHAEERQRLGNPLHLRRALARGVTVVMAHCASLGQNPDLDAPSQPWVDNFDLFWRLFQDPQWDGLLYGETAAMALVNRLGRPMQTLLEHPELHHRLVNGSDYPLPAINVLMQTRAMVEKGFITEAERTSLNELDRHDPLLFDFAVKRTLAWKGQRFADQVFMPGRAFPRLA
jgi:mannonate dehydratase